MFLFHPESYVQEGEKKLPMNGLDEEEKNADPARFLLDLMHILKQG